MARPTSKHPTELELEILKVLWQQGSLSGREVRDTLAARSRDLAYTSVMTVMGIMEDKGYLRRKKQGNGYIYSARIKENSTKKKMMGDMVKRLFSGSAAAAMVNLLESSEVSTEELKQLRKLIQDRERDT